MSGTLQTAPSTTLSDNNQWEYELNLTELAKRGYEGVSLTEWAAGNTTRPEVAAGSVIEINGSTFKYTTDNAISDEAGLTDGWCYLKHVVSGSPQITTPTLTNTFGTWDTAKQGFYDGSGNRYSLFAMYRSGAITKIFTFKGLVSNNEILIQTPLQTDINAQGHIEYTSAIFPGEKIKYKIYSLTGITTNPYQFAHGITNAYTNKRILDIRTTLHRGSAGVIGEYDVFRSVKYYEWDNTIIGLAFAATPTSDDYYVYVTYI